MPLVAVDKGAVSEVCLNAKNGYLCKPGDVDGIANAIVRIVSDRECRKAFSEKSVEIAHEHDFENTLDKFISIYNTVTGKRAER